jgi:hypothetical protein
MQASCDVFQQYYNNKHRCVGVVWQVHGPSWPTWKIPCQLGRYMF